MIPPFPLDAARRQRLEDALSAAIGVDQPELVQAARYVMGWEDSAGRPAPAGGKRVRPSLCVFACEALGGSFDDALPGAVAVELVHNFSLVHDEIQDRDLDRHGRPTVWRLVGEAQGINVGDYLHAAAIAALTGRGDHVDRRMAALKVLNDAVSSMVAGQWLDLSFESRVSVTEADYLAMVSGKTGALLGAPLEMGALLAGTSPEVAGLLGRWGRDVGLAFQAQDDYLGIWGDPAVTGKSNTNDIRRRKMTLPVVIAHRDRRAREVISAEYSRMAGDVDVRRVVSVLEEVGAAARCREVAAELVQKADRLLDSAPLPADLLPAFRGIGRALINRSA